MGPAEPDESLEDDAGDRVPERVLHLDAAGLLSDDLTVAEVAATGGPTYDLDDLDLATVSQLTARLDSAGIQWAIDGAGSLIVHVNDERRADEVVDEVFGPDGDEALATPVDVGRGNGLGAGLGPESAVQVAGVPRIVILLALVGLVVLVAVALG